MHSVTSNFSGQCIVRWMVLILKKTLSTLNVCPITDLKLLDLRETFFLGSRFIANPLLGDAVQSYTPMSEICSTLTIKTPKRRRSRVAVVNFEQISHTNLPFCEKTPIEWPLHILNSWKGRWKNSEATFFILKGGQTCLKLSKKNSHADL